MPLSKSASDIESLESEARFLFSLAGQPSGSLDFVATDRSERWSPLLQMAADEAALVRMREHFSALPPESLPAGFALQLAVVSLDVDRRMNALGRRLEETLVRLNAAGIEPFLLKGTALALTTYGGWTRRPMHDIDLLVAEHEIEAARAAALAAGWLPDARYPGDSTYRSHHHLAPLLDGEGSMLRLEIHRELLPPGHPFSLSRAEIRAEAQRVSVGAAQAFVMSARHNATHAAIHFVWSHLLRAGAWKAFRDVGMLVATGQLEWIDVARTAMQARAASCGYWTLRLGRTLSGLPVPEAVLQRLRPRLPTRVLDGLERHFSRWLLRTQRSCPSFRLERLLWTTAIQPRRHGHGRVRPWLVSTELNAEMMRLSGSDRQRSERFAQVSRSSAYLAGLISAGMP